MPRNHEYVDDSDFGQEDDDQEIPDVDWIEDLKNIEDDDLRQKEIQEAEKIKKEEMELRDRLDRGEIGFDRYETIRQCTLLPKMRKARTRCGLASVGLTYDDLGDITEDSEYLHREGARIADLKDRLKSTIADIGPDAAQALADSLHEEEALSKDTHDRISRQVRIYRRRNK